MLPFFSLSDQYNEISKVAEVFMQKQIDTEPTEPDIASMAALYQQYAPAIFTYLLRHISSEEDAEDILVEVFLAALESERFSLLPEKAQLA